MIRVDDRVWLVWVLWILLLPIHWLCAAVFASIIHELSHICAIYLLGGTVREIYVMPLGARIETEDLCGLREAICALAGPAGSFSVVFLIHIYPILGLCGLVQGLYNLLPLYPQDGGRALRRILEVVIPLKHLKAAEFVIAGLVITVFVGMMLLYLS